MQKRDSGLHNEGASSIGLLFPVPQGQAGVGAGIGQESPQLGTLVMGRAANNGAGGVEEIPVNGESITWIRDDAGLLTPFTTSFFRLKNNTTYVTDWIPCTMRGVRTNPISPNGVATFEATGEMLPRQMVYYIPFTSVVIQTAAAGIVQAVICVGRAALL